MMAAMAINSSTEIRALLLTDVVGSTQARKKWQECIFSQSSPCIFSGSVGGI